MVVMPGLLLLAVLDAANAANVVDAEAIQTAIEEFNDHAVFALPILNPVQTGRLLSGQVVRMLERPSTELDARRAVAYLIMDLPRNAIWVGCQDPHFTLQPSLTEERLERHDDGRGVWYGFVDLPRPFSDRHWVVDVWNNHAMAAATDDRAWEHPWVLRPEDVGRSLIAPHVQAGHVGELTPALVDDAVYTTVNQGAWAVMALPDGRTLFGYHAASVVGGNIPERLIAEYVLSGLEKLLRGIEARASSSVKEHYTQGHEPISSGNGSMVPTF